MEDSILLTIKQMMGLPKEIEEFDADLIININTVFMVLNQLGVGSENPFMIENEEATWNSFLEDDTNFAAIKTYIYLKVRLMFDPPATSFLISSIENQAAELEWRLMTQAGKRKDGVDE